MADMGDKLRYETYVDIIVQIHRKALEFLGLCYSRYLTSLANMQFHWIYTVIAFLKVMRTYRWYSSENLQSNFEQATSIGDTMFSLLLSWHCNKEQNCKSHV